MLYVTTRMDRDAFTPFRAMTCDLGPTGGQYLPMVMPRFDEAGLRAVAERGFNENVAWILSLLCRKELTGRDIDLVTGKGGTQPLELNSRTVVAEVWRNAACSFDEYVLRLFRLLVKDPGERPGQWFTMAVRIGQLFGIFGELMARGRASAEAPLDLAVPSMDFQAPMAAWYARGWGLPIGTIICCCNENNAPWSLLHQGEMRTDQNVRHTLTAACDQAAPAGLERLIYGVLGSGEVDRYAAAVAAGKLYSLEPEQRDALREGLFVSVVSQRRMEFMIPNIYRAGGWRPDLYAAMAYAGLVDQRAQPGDTGRAMIIAENGPLHCAGVVAGMLGIDADALRQILENT